MTNTKKSVQARHGIANKQSRGPAPKVPANDEHEWLKLGGTPYQKNPGPFGRTINPDKRTNEEVDAGSYIEVDYRSKDYIGFAGEWAKGIRKDIADGKVCKDYPKGCAECKDHTARTQSSNMAVRQ